MLKKDLGTELKQVIDKIKSQDLSENSKKALVSDVTDFIQWFEENKEAFSFDDLIDSDVVDYKRFCIAKKLSAATINRRLASLRKLFKASIAEGFMKSDFTQNVKLIPSKKLGPKSLEENELNRLVRKANKEGNLRDLLILTLMAYAGLRVSEVINLTVDAIEISDRSGELKIMNSKRNRSRIVPINNKVRLVLKAYLDKVSPENELFVGQRGPLTNLAINKIVEKYAKKAEIKCSPHVLRHCFAYAYLRENENDLIGLAQILGHSNINTTAIYGQNSLKALQEKVEKI